MPVGTSVGEELPENVLEMREDKTLAVTRVIQVLSVTLTVAGSGSRERDAFDLLLLLVTK